MVELPIEVVKRRAWILGAASAAAECLREYDKRSADGEDVAIFEEPPFLLVGPAQR